MATQRTTEGKMVLFHAATGQRREFWPVDGRGMLETGDYTTDPPGTGLDAPAVTVSAPSEHLPTEYAPGVPLVLTHAHDASPSRPLAEPVRSTRGKR